MPYIAPKYDFSGKSTAVTGQSAQSVISNHLNDSSPISFEDFYREYTGYNTNPYGFFGKLDNVFTGKASSAEQAYQNYLADYEFNRSSKATATANKETYAREDSQIERLMEGYQRAGLNPYALLVGGNLSSGVVSSQAQRPDYKRASKREREKSKSGSVLSTALKLLAILAIKG